MHARRRNRQVRRTSDDGVKLNVAAMLDMAFQLLAFFILTFRVSPVEAQIALLLPNTAQVTNTGSQSDNEPPEITDFVLDLTIQLYANEDGTVSKITIGSHIVESSEPDETIRMFKAKMRSMFDSPFCDGIVVKVQKQLQYEPLMQVVDFCTKQKATDGAPITRISVVALD